MRIAKRVVCLGVLAFGLALPSGAAAAIAVSNQNDSGPGSLRQAVIDAPPGETITVPDGTYALASQIPIEKPLTINGQSKAGTVLSGGGASRIFFVNGAGNDVTITDLTLRDGRAPAGEANGGAILAAETAGVTLRRVIATGNVVDASGGPGEAGGAAQGGVLSSVGGNVAIFDSALTGNLARAAGGSEKSGGVAQGGAVFMVSGVLTLERSDLSSNRALAPGGQGPANAGQGGGVAQGGAVFLVTSVDPKLAATTLGANLADASGGPGAGGGVAQGGGLFLVGGKQSIPIADTTVAANVGRATGAPAGIVQGAGIFLVLGEAKASVVGVTLAGNDAGGAGLGGNVYAVGEVALANTIVSGGLGAPGASNCSAPLESGGFNLESTDECGLKAASDRVDTDPLLGPLQDNGGPGPTMAPAFGGPAVDQGAAFGLVADQRGLPRPIDFPTVPGPAFPGADGSDIGAVELQASTDFGLRKLSRNKKKGIARIRIRFPSPTFGTVVLFGKGLKKKKRTVREAGTVSLFIVPKGVARKKLQKRGKRKVRVKVRYKAAANAPLKKAKTVKLVKKKKKAKGHKNRR
ncbi:MAG: choice-of-anchor Q domain-containing protein [Solirubrobacterales bacterium]